MLKVRFSDNSAFSKQTTSDELSAGTRKTKQGNRIQISNDKGNTINIRTISKKILDHKPGFDLFNWLGIRKRVILHVQEEHIEKDGKMEIKEGYVAVNAESLRKHLGLKNKDFYKAVKKDEDSFTSFIEKKITQASLIQPEMSVQKKSKTEGIISFIKNAINRVEQTLNRRYANQWNQVGLDYLKGINGKEVDERQAVKFFQKAAGAGNRQANGNLAYCYSHGKGVVRDSNKAKTNLGKALKGLEPYDKNLWLTMFAKKGISEAETFAANDPTILLIFADGYLKGENEFSLNPEKAFKLFQKISELGGPHGFENMAYCYSKGIGVNKDTQKAQDALKGMLNAYKNINDEHAKKYGVKTEYLQEKAISLINLEKLGVSELENVCKTDPALYVLMGRKMLGLARFGPHGDEGRRKAVDFFQKAIECSLPEAYVYLATCYKKGLGVEKDERRAEKEIKTMRSKMNDNNEVARLNSLYEDPNFAVFI